MNVELAVVASLSPLEVRPKGRLTDVPVTRRIQALPGDLAVGDEVAVVTLDRQVWLLGRGDPA